MGNEAAMDGVMVGNAVPPDSCRAVTTLASTIGSRALPRTTVAVAPLPPKLYCSC